MKNTILKNVFALIMAFIALPMMGQDYLKIYFKDGHTERHFMHLVNNISTSKYDLEGNLHDDYQIQQIIMEDTTYSYYFADIDSMTFRKVDEEKLIPIIENAVTSIESLYKQSPTIDDMEKHIDEIKNIEGVEDVWREGLEIVVQFRDWYSLYLNYHDNSEYTLNNLGEIEDFLKRIKQSRKLPWPEDGKPIKVAIALQMEYNPDSEEKRYYLHLLEEEFNKFKEQGFVVDFFPNEKTGETMDMDFYKSRMFDYDILIVSTHGSIIRGKHGFYTDQKLPLIALSFYVSELLIDMQDIGVGCSDGLFYRVSEDFIKKSKNRFKNGGPHIVFWGACHTLEGEGTLTHEHNGETEEFQNSNSAVADIFFDKGADVFLSYNRSTSECNRGAYVLFDLMLNGYSLEAAYYNLYDNITKEPSKYQACLIDLVNKKSKYDNPKNIFLFETHTTVKTQQEVDDELNRNGVLELRSTTHVNNIEAQWSTKKTVLKYGFRIAKEPNVDQLNVGQYQEDYSTNTHYTGIETGQVEFSTVFKPEPGETYHYRAFTYDGIHYNWGEEREFTAKGYDNLTLSTNSVSLKVGETSTVDITAGNGSYSIVKIEPEGVVKASVSENHISIEALTAGSAVITVKDDKSGETAPIEVKVWNRLSLATNGSIDLKVGETSTVDITAGNGSYSIDKIEPEGVVKASVSENHISIEALTAGSAVITLKDDKSGETANIVVTVTVRETSIETETFTVNGVSFKMVAVEGGTVTLGDNWETNAFPLIDVTLNSFYIGETEVSQALWEAVMGDNPSKFKGDNLPVTNVSWYKCQEFIARLNQLTGRVFRLPTEAEWEFAARGGIHSKGYKYSGSNNYDDVSWFYGNSNHTIKPVLSKQPNEIGLYNMSGNVSELCNDYYEGGISGTVNPVGPNLDWEEKRAVRPSNVYNSALPVWYRNDQWPDDVYDVVGLRLAGGGGVNTIFTSCPDSPHPHMIDLGLPSGTKWACCNLEAVTPESHGRYYAWGETKCKDWYDTSIYSFYKYAEGYSEIGFDSDISDTQYDVAKQRWGDSWIMPTSEQYQELYDNCSFELSTQNGKQGCLVTGPNGASIFFPAEGAYVGNPIQLENSGFYYTSTCDTSDVALAHIFAFDVKSKEIAFSKIKREIGLQIRPVKHPGIARLILSSISPVTLLVGDNYKVEIISGNGNYEVSCSDEAVATASISDTTIIITGKADGTVFVTVKDVVSRKTLDIKVTVYGIQPCLTCPDDHHPHLIDLGLPSGTKWACCNVGADKPEANGGYYSWGETVEKSKYDYSNYTVRQENGYIKDIGNDISGTEYDVAHVVWGGPWVMPSLDQVQELLDNCSYWWTKENGVGGYVFKGKNDGRIFIPAAGYDGKGGDNGFYWTSTVYLRDKQKAYSLYFYDYRIYTNNYSRYGGHSVRPVFK